MSATSEEPVQGEGQAPSESEEANKVVAPKPVVGTPEKSSEMSIEDESKIGRRQRARVEICSHNFLNQPFNESKRTYLPSGLEGLLGSDVVKDLQVIQSSMPLVPLPTRYSSQYDHRGDYTINSRGSSRHHVSMDESVVAMLNGRKPEEVTLLRRQICNSELSREQVEVSYSSLQRHIEAASSVMAFQNKEYVGGILTLQMLLLGEHSELMKDRRKVYAAATMVLAKMGSGKRKAIESDMNKEVLVIARAKISKVDEEGVSLDRTWKVLCGDEGSEDMGDDSPETSDSMQGGRSSSRRRNVVPGPDTGLGIEEAQCVFTSCVGGPPFLKPLLLSPLSEIPDRSLATNLSTQYTDWKDMTPDILKTTEDKRLKRYRIEADVLQLKSALKQVKDCAKELNRQKQEALDQSKMYKTTQDKMRIQLQDFKTKCAKSIKDLEESEEKKPVNRKGKGRGSKAK